MIRLRSPAPLAPFPLLLLAACAGPSDFPSLAIRDVERAISIDEPVREAPAVVSDPALRSRAAALGAEARASDAAFARAMGQAEQLARSAGTSGSESWIVAQQALSRAEAARTPIVHALTELDALVRVRAGQPTNAEDFAALLAEAEAIRRIVEEQQSAFDAVRARLGS